MSKLKYTTIILHILTCLVATRGYELNYNCLGLINTYISLLVKQYPKITLPDISYEELLKIAKHEAPSETMLCGPNAPYGSVNCGIPSILKGSKESRILPGILEELRHFQTAAKYLGATGSPNQSTKEPPKFESIQKQLKKLEIAQIRKLLQKGVDLRHQQRVLGLARLINSKFSDMKQKWFNGSYKQEWSKGYNGGSGSSELSKKKPIFENMKPHNPGSEYESLPYGFDMNKKEEMVARPVGSPEVSRPIRPNGFGISPYQLAENHYAQYGSFRPSGGVSQKPGENLGVQSGHQLADNQYEGNEVRKPDQGLEQNPGAFNSLIAHNEFGTLHQKPVVPNRPVMQYGFGSSSLQLGENPYEGYGILKPDGEIAQKPEVFNRPIVQNGVGSLSSYQFGQNKYDVLHPDLGQKPGVFNRPIIPNRFGSSPYQFSEHKYGSYGILKQDGDLGQKPGVLNRPIVQNGFGSSSHKLGENAYEGYGILKPDREFGQTKPGVSSRPIVQSGFGSSSYQLSENQYGGYDAVKVGGELGQRPGVSNRPTVQNVFGSSLQQIGEDQYKGYGVLKPGGELGQNPGDLNRPLMQNGLGSSSYQLGEHRYEYYPLKPSSGTGHGPGGNLEGFNRFIEQNGYGIYQLDGNRYEGYGAFRPEMGGYLGGIHHHPKIEIENKQQEGGMGFYQKNKEQIEHNKFGEVGHLGVFNKTIGLGSSGGLPYQQSGTQINLVDIIRPDFGVKVLNSDEIKGVNQQLENPNSVNGGMMEDLKQGGGFYGKEILTDGFEHKTDGGMNVFKQYETHNEETHHEDKGPISNQQPEQESAVNKPDNPQADKIGFYLAGGEVKGPPSQQQSAIKWSKLLQGIEAQLKKEFEESKKKNDDIVYMPAEQSEIEKAKAEGLEIIEPGAAREVVRGGQKVLISNTNCPDKSGLCISIA